MGSTVVSSVAAEMVSNMSDFTIGNVLIIVGAAIGIAVPLVIGWFAINYIKRKASGALKGGNI